MSTRQLAHDLGPGLYRFPSMRADFHSFSDVKLKNYITFPLEWAPKFTTLPERQIQLNPRVASSHIVPEPHLLRGP